MIGSEVLLKYKPDERFFGWIAYTLSRSARVDGPGEPEHLVQYDQTHILTVLGSYRLGHGWEFGARFRLVSGNLITPSVCDKSAADCDPNRTGSLFHAPSGVYTPIPFAGAFSERLPLFHQLDIRVDKGWQFPRWKPRRTSTSRTCTTAATPKACNTTSTSRLASTYQACRSSRASAFEGTFEAMSARKRFSLRSLLLPFAAAAASSLPRSPRAAAAGSIRSARSTGCASSPWR